MKSVITIVKVGSLLGGLVWLSVVNVQNFAQSPITENNKKLARTVALLSNSAVENKSEPDQENRASNRDSNKKREKSSTKSANNNNNNNNKTAFVVVAEKKDGQDSNEDGPTPKENNSRSSSLKNKSEEDHHQNAFDSSNKKKSSKKKKTNNKTSSKSVVVDKQENQDRPTPMEDSTTTVMESLTATEEQKCDAAALTMQQHGIPVHAGADASVVIAPYGPHNSSTAFKVGRLHHGSYKSFHRKTKVEHTLLTRYTSEDSSSPLLRWIAGPCHPRPQSKKNDDENNNSRMPPFYAVEGGMIQWRSAREEGLFDQMAWCQRLDIGVQIDAAMVWLQQHGLEFDSYNWDDRTGGTGERQIGISIDHTAFRFLDSDFVYQNDTKHWASLRERAKKTYKPAVVEKLKASNFAHGLSRMRRAMAKILMETLLGTTVDDWRCHDDIDTTESCMSAWTTFRKWTNDQAVLPYDAVHYSPTLSSALLDGVSDAQSSCLRASRDTQRTLLTNAYEQELTQAASRAKLSPDDTDKY